MALTNKTYLGASYLDIAKLISLDFFGVAVSDEQLSYIVSPLYNGKVQVAWSSYSNYITIYSRAGGYDTYFQVTISGKQNDFYATVPIVLEDKIKYIQGFVIRDNLIKVNNYAWDYAESLTPLKADLAAVSTGNIVVASLYSDTKIYDAVFSYAIPQTISAGLYYIGGSLCYLHNGYAWALE